MNLNTAPGLPAPDTSQPVDVCGMDDVDRDALIVSAAQVDDQWSVLSRYGDAKWRLTGWASNKAPHEQLLDFKLLPTPFRRPVKAVVYRYMRRGRAGRTRPTSAAIKGFFTSVLPFLRYLDRLQIKHLGQVTPMLTANYAAECRSYRQCNGKNKGKPLAASTLNHRYWAIELLYELSRFTDNPIAQHPWPETSAKALAGLTGRHLCQGAGKTPVIPDDVFTTLFQRAYDLVERGAELLDLRDELELVESTQSALHKNTIMRHKNRCLHAGGWTSGLYGFRRALVDLRTACYIVVASTSGCRNHELAYVQSRAWTRSEDDEGTIYHWLRSRSVKTDAGNTHWMIPDAAVKALRVMDRWAMPYQAMIVQEVAVRRATNPRDPEIAEAQKHQNAVFLGMRRGQSGAPRTLSLSTWNVQLKAFAREYCGVDWALASHQFRRTFAYYAARSQFGDLRYLKSHYKHWSMDMTLGYALNESQEMDLYLEIQDELDQIKTGVTDAWFKADRLAGGYGRAINDWRSREENITLFRDRASMVKAIADSTAIRSNGHAWCSADDAGCIGNTLEPTRCSDCRNAVIGPVHGRVYQRLHDDLQELAEQDDIGPGGRARVRRDITRCRQVLLDLGYDPRATHDA